MGRIRLAQGVYPLTTEEETFALGKKLAHEIPSNAILALEGDLGSGKTTFVKGLAMGLNIRECIQSPTFVLMNHYPGLFHFDLYRLKNSEGFLSLGFEECFESGEILAIEWPDRIQDILPQETIYLHFSYVKEMREVRI